MNGIVVIDLSEKVFNGRVKVIVKEGVLKILKAVEKKVGNGYEFSVLFKGYWDDEKGAYVVDEDYYIPRQRVRSAFVEITEDVAGKIASGYIVAFHKHPRGLRSFSGHDYQNICAVFPISLLYVDGEIPVGTVKVPLPDARAVVLVEADVEIENDELPEVNGVENIEKEAYTYGGTYRFSGTDGFRYPDDFRRYYGYGDVRDIDDEADALMEMLASELEECETREDVEDVLRSWGYDELAELISEDNEAVKKVVSRLLERFGNVKVH